MNNINDYLEILIKNHKNFLNDIVKSYFTNYYNQQIFTYFKIFFFYYLITTYVYKPNLNIVEIKKTFFSWINQTLNTTQKKLIIKNFEYQYNYLFKVFFVDKNIFFHVYFNNLIKYFLPLPFELNIYSPIITYRSNVHSFYKKNNIDYLDIPNKFDLSYNNTIHYYNDVDIHIPMQYFNTSLFDNINVIYLVAKKNKLYICDSNKNILYSRINNFNNNAEKYIKDFDYDTSLEELFPIWEKENGRIDFSEAFYINVMKNISNTDLFNVFKKYNVTTNNYKYLFHNAYFTEDDNYSDVILNKETFFYLIPSTKNKYFKEEEKRKCVMFEINNDINNLLDLTSTIVTNNNFTKNLIIKDKNSKKWISYDSSKVLEYYKNGTIPTKYDDNFQCLTTTNLNLKSRPYCDIDNLKGGRRKLQEILFKIRKYKYKHIYISTLKKDISEYEKYKIYHPSNVPVNVTWDFDKFILKELNYNGFFFVDYGDAVDGGEILLINPKKYIEKKYISEKTCFDKEAFPNLK